jgi:hypothetical protein
MSCSSFVSLRAVYRDCLVRVESPFRPYRYRWVFELAFLSCERPWDVGYGSVSSARGWLTVIGRSAFRDDSTAN